MNVRIENLPEKKLIGMKVTMSISENTTFLLWHRFMQRRKEITNNVSDDFISMQLYDKSHFKAFNPNAKFEKWATVEVSDFEKIPDGMEPFVLPAGLYAVFIYKVSEWDGTTIFNSIFEEWLPNSEYQLDSRPHFEVLGKKYDKDSKDSEEEIWIPVRFENK